MTADIWREHVRNTIRIELKRRQVSYSDLADKLAEIGIYDTEKNLAKRISRGTFNAQFLFQCLEAIGCETVCLPTKRKINRASESEVGHASKVSLGGSVCHP
jgi:hypothetical protein